MGQTSALAKQSPAPIRLQDLSPAGIIELPQKQRDVCYAVAEKQLWEDFAAWLESKHPDGLQIEHKGRGNQTQQERELLDSYLDEFLPVFALEVGPRAGWSETVKLKVVAWTDSNQTDKGRAWRRALDQHDDLVTGKGRVHFELWHKSGRDHLVDECRVLQDQLRKDYGRDGSFDDICRIIESKPKAWTMLYKNLTHIRQWHADKDDKDGRATIEAFAKCNLTPATFVTALLVRFYSTTPRALDVALSPSRLKRELKRKRKHDK